MAAKTAKIRQSFPLNTVGDLMERLRLPTGRFDVSGNWSVTYGVFAIARKPVQTGRLELRRKAADGIVLQLHMDKQQPGGHVQRITARMNCRADTLSTPVKWQFQAELLTPGKKPVRNTKIRKTAAVKDGKLVLKDAAGEKRIALPRAYTVNWALFDAVTRLPRRAFKPIAFDLIDHFDQLKDEQVLAYRGSRTVELARRKVRLHAFDHLGRGIVPWVYFVDERGVLVLAASGLEAYGLLAAEQAKGGAA